MVIKYLFFSISNISEDEIIFIKLYYADYVKLHITNTLEFAIRATMEKRIL